MRTRIWRVTIVLLLSLCAAAQAVSNPVADPKAIVISGQARFTILTPQLIRMEWSETGKFEDHGSLVFINRRLPVPAFQVEHRDRLVIKTAKLALSYAEGSGQFTAQNLEVSIEVPCALNARVKIPIPSTKPKYTAIRIQSTLVNCTYTSHRQAGNISEAYLKTSDVHKVLSTMTSRRRSGYIVKLHSIDFSGRQGPVEHLGARPASLDSR